jgi:pepF/M3 family oligoendopeptidase
VSETATLPHWDMSVVYPGLDAPEFEAGYAEVAASIADLAALFDRHGVGAGAPPPLGDETVAAVEEVLARYNAVLDAARTLDTYITTFIATDSRDDLAQARTSAFDKHTTVLSQLGTRFVAWLGALDVEGVIERSALAAEHAFVLREAQVRARRLMSPVEEELAAELNVTGGAAWAKLHSNLSSQISVALEQDGDVRHLPMSVVRNLAYDPDRALRQAAHTAELRAWEAHALPLASALNGIKGQVDLFARRRGWESPLAESLFQNRIDQETLEAMLQAARESFPDFRRYLRAKARALRVPVLAWYDLFAPLPDDTGTVREWTWDESRAFLIEVFATYSPTLGAFAERAFREHWIDAEPRPGKEDGAFCVPLRGDESRILTNFKPGFAGVSTLAHELGHGYHNVQRARRPILQRTTPMALSETASIFCETLLRDAALLEASAGERLAILEASLQGACQVVVDITSRFQFEQGVFERRRERELSVAELNGLMLAAQRDTYGDGLDQDVLHPYMWAVKSHYYSPGRSYYNYPYMFGLLFALGLYTRYRAEPAAFRAGYDDLLSSTGLADAATLAERFGIDIRTPDFWRSSLASIRQDIDRFEQLVEAGDGQ